MGLLPLTLVVILSAGSLVQSPQPTASAPPAPRVELGMGADEAFDAHNLFPSLDVRVNVTPRLAVTTAADFWLSSPVKGVRGAYLVDLQRALGRLTRRVTPVLRIGVAGEVWPRTLRRPFGVLVGTGVHTRLSSRWSLDGGAQLLIGGDGPALLVGGRLHLAIIR
jgi:hypothetical protein